LKCETERGDEGELGDVLTISRGELEWLDFGGEQGQR
jgi:hypothetical protein